MKRSATLEFLTGFAIAAATVVVLIALLSPNDLRAEYQIPGTQQRIAVDLLPLKPGRGEYEKALVLIPEKGSELEFSLFPDSGGYSRSQLYHLADGSYLVKGHFDATQISPDFKHLEYISTADAGRATYLGSFSFDADDKWRFVDASESPEETMVPGGG